MINHREGHRNEAIGPGVYGPRGSVRTALPTRWSAARADARATLAGLVLVAPLVVAMLLRSLVLFMGALGLVLFVSVLSPLIGMVALAFVSPFPRPLGLPTAAYYVAIAGAILLGLILRLPIERPRLTWPQPHVWAIGAFLAYAAVHVLGGVLDGPQTAQGNALDPSSTIVPTFTQFLAGALTFVAAGFVIRGRSPYALVAALLAGAVLASMTAVGQSLGAEGLFGGLMGPPEDRNVTAVDRVTGPFLDPNYFGAYLATATTLALACTVIARSTWTRALTMAVSAFVGLGLILTLSRGALVALVAGIITMAFTRGRKTGFVAIGLMLLATVAVWPFFADVRFAADPSRAQGGLGSQLGESSDRTGAWLGGIEAFLSSPVFGVGWGRLVEEAATEIRAHNWYVTVLGETGIMGFILWVLFVVSCAIALRKRSRPARTVGYSVLVSWMVASMFIEVPLVFAATGLALVALAVTIAADWPVGDPEDARVPTRVGPRSIFRIDAGLRPSTADVSARAESAEVSE